jgi:hypothetical protein
MVAGGGGRRAYRLIANAHSHLVRAVCVWQRAALQAAGAGAGAGVGVGSAPELLWPAAEPPTPCAPRTRGFALF